MTLRWCGSDGLDDGTRVGCGGALAVARAHPHMPRRSKSKSPLRASGGSGSPSMALRKLSYCAATAGNSAEHFSAMPRFTCASEFFLHRVLARSSGGAH